MTGANQSAALKRLATFHGVQTSYIDATGKKRDVSQEALHALLNALGVDAANDRQVWASLREAEEARARPSLEAVYALWGQRLHAISPPGSTGAKTHGQIELEDGSIIQLAANKNGRPLNLPKLPLGYHQLRIDTGGRVHQALLICAPKQAYAMMRDRRWGVFTPLYALHSNESWGAGDFMDCRNFAQWLHSRSGDVLALLPVFAAFLDEPFDPSPYAPVSRLFWNEFYLHVPAIPEFGACSEARKLVGSAAFARRIEHQRNQSLIDYREQMRQKRSVLERLSHYFFSTASRRRTEFERFLKSRPQVGNYARFRAVTERLRQGWPHWPERLRGGKILPEDYDIAAEQYHLFVQWCAQQQIEQLRSTSTALYLDLPLGVNADGFDAWRHSNLFAADVSGGAPPDPFFTKGQDWGFRPLHPQELRKSRYRYYIEFIRFAMRHTGLLRLDHVMGLHRLYWVPKGFPASQGAYVTYPAEEFYAILCLESHRHKTALVGENLGTVPPEVNKAMARHGFSDMYVVQYEQSDHTRALHPPPKRSVASLNTHDMPPFAAHWKGLDLPDRAALGLLTRDQLQSERHHRKEKNQVLVRFLRRGGFLKKAEKTTASDVLRACLRFLSRSEAELVLVNLEDLWNEIHLQNTPGTFRERPNWRRKTGLSLEQIQAAPEIGAALAEVNRLRKRKGPSKRN